MTDVALYPWVANQFFTDNGDVAAGYLLWTYKAGTSDELTTWQDEAFATENSNPIVLDSAGRANIYFDSPAKFVLVDPEDDSDPPHSNLWTVDLVPSHWYYGISTTLGRNLSGDPVATEDAFVVSTGRANLYAVMPYRWVTVYSRHPFSSSTGDISIPAGTLDGNGDALELEWKFTYTAAQPVARATVFGTDVDLGIAVNSTVTWASFTIYRVDANNVRVMATVFQNTGAGNAQVAMADTAIGSLDLDANDYTVELTNDTSTGLDFARVKFGSTVGTWENLTPAI